MSLSSGSSSYDRIEGLKKNPGPVPDAAVPQEVGGTGMSNFEQVTRLMGTAVVDERAVVTGDQPHRRTSEEDALRSVLAPVIDTNLPILGIETIWRTFADLIAERDPSFEAAPTEDVFVIFDGPPSAESGRFVEVENAEGKSVGTETLAPGCTWRKDPDSNLWSLGPFRASRSMDPVEPKTFYWVGPDDDADPTDPANWALLPGGPGGAGVPGPEDHIVAPGRSA